MMDIYRVCSADEHSVLLLVVVVLLFASDVVVMDSYFD